MKHIFSLIFTLLFMQGYAQQEYRKDFEYLWSLMNDDYAYWDKKSTNWAKVKVHYAPLFDTVSSKRNFILLLEKVFNEIYDHHASLNVNTKVSQRLVPSGTDIWAEYVAGKPIVSEVRPGFGAAHAGIKAGMEIISVDDIPVVTGLKRYLPVSLNQPDTAAINYALRIFLACFSDNRKITVKDGSITKIFYPDRPKSLLTEYKFSNDIESNILQENIGYIKINNRLGDNNLIVLFDSVLGSLLNTNSLILDLRETPGGGNTTVARAIMGSFITKGGYYQKHELPMEERRFGVKRSWDEIVTPRKQVYSKPLVILVNHWTGSVGEGISIGFHALKRAVIIGTPMAALNGAIYTYQMPESKIGFSFPVEKLFHINGQPREDFIPDITVDLTKQGTREDVILSRALKFLKGK